MATARIKQSLEAVANNLNAIRGLTNSAKRLYEQSHSPRIKRHVKNIQSYDDNQHYLSSETLKLRGKKMSSSSFETDGRFTPEAFTIINDAPTNSERNEGNYSNINHLPTLLDLITRQYNEQIGTLVNNIDRLSKKIIETKQQNKLLKKQLQSGSRQTKRTHDTALNLPVMAKSPKCETDGRPLLLSKRQTGSMILFKRSNSQVDKNLQRVKAAPAVQHYFGIFRKRLNQLNGNALNDYLN